MDGTRTRMTGPRTSTQGPTRFLVNRRPLMDQIRMGTWLVVASGGAIRGNQDLEICSRVPLGLLVTRRPADGTGKDGDVGAKDEDKGAKDKAKGPTR